MLNHKKLEEKLDAALAKETPETLRKWLNEKRKKNELGRLGEGVFVEMESESFQIPTDFKKPSKYALEGAEIILNKDYSLAA